jgi:hypothetical protein
MEVTALGSKGSYTALMATKELEAISFDSATTWLVITLLEQCRSKEQQHGVRYLMVSLLQ